MSLIPNGIIEHLIFDILRLTDLVGCSTVEWNLRARFLVNKADSESLRKFIKSILKNYK